MAGHPDSSLSSPEPMEGVRVTLPGLRRLRGAATRLGIPPPGILSHLFPGAFRARFHGRGIEFMESRHYQPGDDFRSLDWRVSARSGRLHTKLYQEEREQHLFLVLDAGPAMHFGTRSCFKWVAAARAAALLGWLAVIRGDRLGCLLFGTTLEAPLHPPATGESALFRLFQRFAAISSDNSRPPDLETALRQTRELVPPGSLILVISDFQHLTPGWEFQLAALAGHHEIGAIAVHDPIERDLPVAGLLPVTDGARILEIDTGDRALRKRFHDAFERRHRELASLFRRHRGVTLELGTHEEPSAALRRRLPGAAEDRRPT